MDGALNRDASRERVAERQCAAWRTSSVWQLRAVAFPFECRLASLERLSVLPYANLEAGSRAINIRVLAS